MKIFSVTLTVLLIFFVFYPSAGFAEEPDSIDKKNKYGFSVSQTIHMVKEAGDILMSYYKEPVDAEYKADHSPVTRADIAVNTYLENVLKELTPDIPVISEEGKTLEDIDNVFWLIDPMDGTKSFINKTGQFTVNAGLIDNGRPVFGIIYAPVSGDLYYTSNDMVAYKTNGADHTTQKLQVRTADISNLTLVASRLHRSEEDEEFVRKFGVKNFLTMSSSIKFCLIAEGKADIYPRLGTTMEWDTAAGHAILKAAGGNVVFKDSGKDFTYKKENFRNTHFVAYGGIDGLPDMLTRQ